MSSKPSELLINGQRVGAQDLALQQALASAYVDRHRPTCLCTALGVEMYIARIGDAYIVKRMPGTGCRHAPACPSYEPDPDSSGLGQVLGAAIVEDPESGRTHLRLDFSMFNRFGTSPSVAGSEAACSATSSGTRLSLRGLLHYLWEQAGLTRWRPAFEGKRSWAVVRRHLLLAASQKYVSGKELLQKLYIAEPFFTEERDAINTRRIANWRAAAAASGGDGAFILMIAELKEMGPARYGHRAIIKHLPDLPFAIDASLYRTLTRRFARELLLWGQQDCLRMVTIATVASNKAGLPMLHEVSLMPVTGEWLPVDSAYDVQLTEKLVQLRRSFLKPLTYNLERDPVTAHAVLTDAGEHPVQLHIDLNEDTGQPQESRQDARTSSTSWRWNPLEPEAMPLLPPVVR